MDRRGAGRVGGFVLIVLVAAALGAARPSLGVGARNPAALFNLSTDIDSIDPALSFTAVSWQLEYATCAKLLNYADSAGPAVLVPEIAASMPSVSPDGLTYTFTIRPNVRFPSGERVSAQAVYHTFQRVLDPALQSPGAFFLSDVTGIEVSANSVRFTLAAPAGDFAARIAMPFFCVVPQGTPFQPAAQPIPSAGPYYVGAYTPVSRDASGDIIAPGAIVLRRNPYYNGTRRQPFKEIDYRTGIDNLETLEQIIAGDADYAPDLAVSPGLSRELEAQYPDRFFVDSRLGFRYLALNTKRPTFSATNVRQAVNYALDRPALAEVFGLTPNDQYLPPGMPGYPDTHPYPLDGPDVATARALLAGAQPTAALYTCDRPNCIDAADIVKENLSAVGFDVQVQTFPSGELLRRLGNPGEPFDVGLGPGVLADYADPFPLIFQLLHRDGLQNFAHFDDPVVNQRIEEAQALLAPARYEAYGALDLDLMQAAPIAVIGDLNAYDFVSAQIGCERYVAAYGMDIAGLCLRK
jgi:peptide/nickel transport system substrate-binding protein